MSLNINLLAKLTIIFLLFDLNFSFDILGGEGERLSQGVDSEGEHVQKASLGLRIKLADMMLLLMIAVQLLSRSSKFSQSITRGPVAFLTIFLLYSVTLLAIQSNLLTSSQMVVSFIYLTKLSLQIYYLTFFVRYFSFQNEVPILKIAAYTAFYAALIGIFSSLTSVPIHFIMSNRIEYYGQIAFISLFMLQALLCRSANGNIFGIKKKTLLALFFVCAISIVLCGKRTPLIGFIVGALYLLLNTFSDKRRYNQKIFIIIFIPFLIILAGSDALMRTFIGSDPIYLGLDSRYSELIQGNDYLSSWSGLDGSSAERIAKILYALDLIFKFPNGIGFWTSIFQHNFIPDSILQFPLENGLLMSVALLYCIFSIIRMCHKSAKSLDSKVSTIGCALKGVLFAMIAMSITVNIAYMFKLIATFFIFYALLNVLYSRSSKHI
jgi:hypothetical protein